MPTVPIVPQETAAAPFAVVDTKTVEYELLAAYAEWDGTGASGTFLPCLAIYSDAGVRLARVFPGTSIAAGSSGVVSYLPLGGAASGGVTEVTSPLDTLTVTDPFGPVVSIDIPAWSTAVPAAYDYPSVTSIGAAFAQTPDASGSLATSYDGGTVLESQAGIVGNFTYVVSDPTKFTTDPLAVAVGAGQPLPLNIGAVGFGNENGAVGAGVIVQTGTGNVYPFTLIVAGHAASIMRLLTAGTPGVYVTKSAPITLAVGDVITGYWSTAMVAL